MGYEPRLITPFVDSGLQKYYKPYIIGNEAFPDIQNAYAYRGVVKKREGFRLFAVLPGGDKPVQGLKNWIDPSTLGNTSIAFSQTKAYRYDSVSGLYVDITFLAFGNGAGGLPGTAFSFGNGPNDYFWASNYAGSLWVTNGLKFTTAGFPATANGIFYWNGTPGALGVSGGWSVHQPQVDGTPTYLDGALIILPYKGRLVVLNTIEGNASGTSTNTFPARARWSQIGTPYVPLGGGFTTSPPPPYSTDANAWRSDIPGRGGFIDADTSERIVSADIVRDTLIVGFQRSTWRLRYTGNEVLPFLWERLNTQFGAESTYSNVAFDEAVLFFSRYGWIGSTTNDVARIDLDIPDDSFSAEATDKSFTGLNRIQAIRDYFRQFAYWTFQSVGSEDANQIYSYNYNDRKWAIYTPSVGIRVFGSFNNTADQTWATLNSATDTWELYNSQDDTWSNIGAGQNTGFPFIIGGDANGNIYQMFEFFRTTSSDNGTNFDFVVATKRFNPYLDKGLKCRMGYVDIYCSTSFGGEITLQHFIDDQYDPVFTRTIKLYPSAVTDISNIAVGVITTVTTTLPHDLTSGQSITLSSIAGSAGNVLNNQTPIVTVLTPTTFTVPVDTTGLAYVTAGYIYYGIFDEGSAKYTRVYLGAIGHMHQFVFTLSDEQLADPIKGTAQFELQGLVIWTRPMGMIRG